jgi:hypothetical protein
MLQKRKQTLEWKRKRRLGRSEEASSHTYKTKFTLYHCHDTHWSQLGKPSSSCDKAASLVEIVVVLKWLRATVRVCVCNQVEC